MKINLAAIVLAAGKGTRMKSNLPKVLHKICGKSMIGYILEAVSKIGSKKNFLVVGYKKEEVIKQIKCEFPFLLDKIGFVIQKEFLGSGHAVLQTKKVLKNFNGFVLVIGGDAPLIEKDTLLNLIKKHKEEKNIATVLTTELEKPFSYGRIVRDDKGDIEKIVEEKETSIQERKIKEINSGIYCFVSKFLFEALTAVNCKNKKGEYYLTDVIKILKNRGCRVGAYKINDFSQIIGVNDRKNLASIGKLMQKKILNEFMLNGVTIVNPEDTYIEHSVTIQKDTTILPGVFIQGKTKIGENCCIGPHSSIKDSCIKNGVYIQNSVVENATVYDKIRIKPFSFISGGNIKN